MASTFEIVKIISKCPGHKQADCPSFGVQKKESNTMSNENKSSSESETDSDGSNTESIELPEVL